MALDENVNELSVRSHRAVRGIIEESDLVIDGCDVMREGEHNLARDACGIDFCAFPASIIAARQRRECSDVSPRFHYRNVTGSLPPRYDYHRLSHVILSQAES